MKLMFKICLNPLRQIPKSKTPWSHKAFDISINFVSLSQRKTIMVLTIQALGNFIFEWYWVLKLRLNRE